MNGSRSGQAFERKLPAGDYAACLVLQGMRSFYLENTVVSTFLSYDLINRDMKASLSRVANQGLIERQTNYYKENIGKVTTVDEFLDDYQLYSYAMEAFGLSEMTYAKAFMRKVLESDLNDDNSFANKLTDTRYRDFASAFNFSSSIESLQTEAQLDSMIGLYSETLQKQDQSLAEETRYFKTMMGNIDNVDQMLRNDRLRAYAFNVFGLNQATYSYAHVRGLMTSDVNDPDSYINQQFQAGYIDAVGKLATKGNIELHAQVTSRIVKIDEKLADAALPAEERTTLEAERVERVTQLGELEAVLPPQAEWEETLAAINAQKTALQNRITSYNNMTLIADAFEFNNDGSVPVTGVISDANLKAITDSYIGSSTRVTETVAKLHREYYESKIGTFTTVEELMADSRVVSYLRTAFNLTGITVVNATVKNILTSDLSDPDNYIATIGKNNPDYLALRNAFNFQSDGTLPADTQPQTALQMVTTSNAYMRNYDVKDTEADEKALASFKSAIGQIDSLSSFLSTGSVYDYALKAVGLDPKATNVKVIRDVLTSDLQDPNSYVYKLKDERYVKLAELFNFKADGSIAAPMLAQSQLDIQAMSAAYVKTKAAFGTEDDKNKAKKAAEDYASEMQKIKTLDDLINNAKVIDFAMEALGLDPESVTKDQLRMIFASDINDPNSYLNKNYDATWRELVTSFNFDTDGKMLREDRNAIQTRRGFNETIDSYIRQMLEIQSGEENAGVRLALYFERMARGVTSYYTILADSAIQEFINTAFMIPDELGNADVDKQVEMMKKYFEIEDFQDPEKVKKLIARFTVLYDTETGSSDPIMMLFNGSGSAGISGDLLTAANTYRSF